MTRTTTVRRLDVYPRASDRTALMHSEVLTRLMDHDPATSRVANVLLKQGRWDNERVELVGQVIPFLCWAARLPDEWRHVVCTVLADFVKNDGGLCEGIAEADDGEDVPY